MRIILNGEKRDVKIKDFVTRAIDREYNKILMKDTATVDGSGTPTIKVNAENIQDAYDYIVCAMTDLTNEEVQELSKQDFDKLFDKIQEIQNPSK